jgi:hypothetical protein
MIQADEESIEWKLTEYVTKFGRQSIYGTVEAVNNYHHEQLTSGGCRKSQLRRSEGKLISSSRKQ